MATPNWRLRKSSLWHASNWASLLLVVPTAIAGLVALVLACPIATADTYQYVRTVSGAVRCMVSQAEVVCERTSIEGFPQAPSTPGGHFILAHVTSTGSFNWNDGNIGNPHPEQDIVLGYGQTYRLIGWTVLPSSDGTRFTNDGTGHGMFVSIDNVSAF